jgi:hypothetical protein
MTHEGSSIIRRWGQQHHKQMKTAHTQNMANENSGKRMIDEGQAYKKNKV